MPTPIDVFISYARKDAALLGELVTHLALLKRTGLVRTWHDREIEAGADWEAEILDRLDAARVVLLLVSADFLASPSCWDREMERAMERHAAGAARVVPILLRACDWKAAPFAALAALPDGERPIQSWPDRDEAWADVVIRLRGLLEKLAPSLPAASSAPSYPDAETRRLAEELERARARQRALREAGMDDAEAREEVLALRRRMREGGQLRAGDRLGQGRYLLLERVGRGGFANVWRARDDERGECVAIKVLHASLAEDSLRRERFFRGAQRMAALDHPGIVRVLDPCGEDGGFHYFVMELIAGADLQRAVLDEQILAEQVVPLLLGVGGALQAAHAAGLVHRDVKPANILVDAAGAPRLTDFDLVAAADTTGGTRTGALGTFVYSAPEVLDRPQDADVRADVYGLGMTALFCLHGAPLPAEVVHDRQAFLRELPCPGTLKAVLEKAVAWKRDQRFASMEELCTALVIACRPRSAGRTVELRQAAPAAAPAGPAKAMPAAHGQAGAADPRQGAPAALPAWALPARPAVAPPARLASSPPARPAVAPAEPRRAAPAPQKHDAAATAEAMVEALAAAPASLSRLARRVRQMDALKLDLTLVAIPGGRFRMGSADDEALAQDDERPRRGVRISSFSMTKGPVTQRLYREVMGQDDGQVFGDLPVSGVSWFEAVAFCNRLSELMGFSPAYRIEEHEVTWLRGADGFRLPTEAEWEYAARGSDERLYPWGDEPPSAQPSEQQLCWSGAPGASLKARARPCPVGRYPKGASPFGLLDMAGNVWEWCWDYYDVYLPRAGGEIDPAGPPAGPARVLRGGSFRVGAASRIRAAARNKFLPSLRGIDIGFRCARGARYG
ncbi:SUMF1/EgtB/PvdO family nonheme iron enzyme [Sorangium sp. So ce861]|uniref:SUMF1/EgtB/PvdO family nonheme iron enzyme n=1 Tax=Sorangium sp. So ce861 TaxID=3133323 RepID=UPI003F62DCFF